MVKQDFPSKPAPVPIVGIRDNWVIPVATGAATASNTSAKQPAASSAQASATSARAGGRPSLRFAAAEHRLRLRRQTEVAHDPIPAPEIARTRSSRGPSSLTA
jgi:hypothetical protein